MQSCCTDWHTATKSGNLDCLKHLCQHRHPPDYTARVAAQYGHIDCLKFLHDKACSLYEAVGNAAVNGHIQCHQYVLNQNVSRDFYSLKGAARYSHIECMKLLLAHGYDWGLSTMDMIAWNGTMECLQFAFDNGCPFDAWCTRRAVHRFEAGCCEREFLEFFVTNGALKADIPRVDSSWFHEFAQKYYWPIIRVRSKRW